MRFLIELVDVKELLLSMTINQKTEKITPETYIKMNEEFEREGTPIRLIIPTQEEIDNPTGVKLPTTFKPQPPMDFSNPWPHGQKDS